MIYLSAQPDDSYFLWQLEVQHRNFEEVGIDLSTVYCLVGYSIEPKKEWIEYQNKTKANIIFYQDGREKRNYLSSIRPYMIKHFLNDYPQFSQEYIFYHDADIIFRELPNFSAMEDGWWHLSNTNSYINYKYVTEKGVDILMDMCEIVGINPIEVKKNNDSSGGAQYFFKGTDYDFWDKVEKDTETMFRTIAKNQELYKQDWIRLQAKFSGDNYGKLKEGEQFDYRYHELQIWCADMWCVLWNGWLRGFKTYCNPELDFSWSTDRIERWEATKIFHNSGVGDSKNGWFNKEEFKLVTPWGLDLAENPQSAQFPYVQLIKKVNQLKFSPVQKQKESESQLIIQKAVWGHHKKVDVTDVIKEKMINQDSSFIAGNSLFGDHEPGSVKFLTIDYQFNGIFKSDNYKENDLVRFSEPKDILGILYTNNINEDVLNVVFEQIKKISGKADIVTCSYKNIKDNPYPALKALNTTGSHFNIMTQILQCLLYAKRINHYKYVAFLEHDVLYPEGYFDFPEFTGDVICNWNYQGLCAEGWQMKNQNDEPMHQIIMKFDAAIKWFSERLVIAIADGSLLEPNQLGIERWDSEFPAIHINHGKHFTSHYNIYSKDTVEEIPYWGNYKKWWQD